VIKTVKNMFSLIFP